VQEVFRKFPWETFHSKSERLKEKLLNHLRELGLRPKDPKRRTTARLAAKAGKGSLRIASIVQAEDLPGYFGLIENLRALASTDLQFHALTCDRATEEELRKRFPTGVSITPGAPWSAAFAPPPPLIQRALLLPRFLKSVVESTADSVLYCEPSVGFYGDPAELDAKLESGHTLLFPQWRDGGVEQPQIETALLVVTAASVPLLNWWTELIDRTVERFPHLHGSANPAFLALAPFLFPGARVYRGKDQAVSTASERSLGLSLAVWNGDAPLIGDGQPVRSFLSGPTAPCYFSRRKTTSDQLAHFFSGSLLGEGSLQERCWRQQSAVWRELRGALSVAGQLASYFPWIPGAIFRRSLAAFISGPWRGWVSRALPWLPQAWVQPPARWGTQAAWPEWAGVQRKYLFDVSLAGPQSSPRTLAQSA